MTENTHASTVPDRGAEAGAPRPGLPARIDVRRAFDVYVYGRNRTLAPGQKDAAVDARLPAARAESEWVELDGKDAPESRVTVPHELRFERSAGTWRDRLGWPDRGKP